MKTNMTVYEAAADAVSFLFAGAEEIGSSDMFSAIESTARRLGEDPEKLSACRRTEIKMACREAIRERRWAR